jgi:hypothetical protein
VLSRLRVLVLARLQVLVRLQVLSRLRVLVLARLQVLVRLQVLSRLRVLVRMRSSYAQADRQSQLLLAEWSLLWCCFEVSVSPCNYRQ